MQTRAASRFLEEIPGEVLRRSIGDAPSTSTEEEKDQLARTAFANIKSMLGD
jgi:hypothetical protein